MPKIKICSEPACQNARTTEKFCRLHYLRNWRQIKQDKAEKAAKRLNSYVESMCKKHPDSYLDKIKKDLKTEGVVNEFMDPSAYTDELDEVMEDLGYKEDSIDNLVKNIKVDEYK